MRFRSVLWVVAVATIVHPVEEWRTGWFPWARATLGIDVPGWLFVIANCVVAGAALLIAAFAWKRTSIALIIPAATLVNALVWHVLPSILQLRVAPGLYSAVLLYLPFSGAALGQALASGAPGREVARGALIGTAIGLGIPLAARAL